MGNFAIAAAVMMVMVLWPVFRHRGYGQACFWTINAGFGFWYWLPAIRILNLPPADSTVQALAPDSFDACAWIVFTYHTAALLVLSLSRKLVLEREAEK